MSTFDRREMNLVKYDFRLFYNKMTGVKCLKCGHEMSRAEIASNTVATVANKYITAGQASSMIDSVLSGTANGFSVKCPNCGSIGSFKPN